MEIFFCLFADTEFESGIGEDFGIHRNTCKTISYVINKIINRSDNWMHFPTIANEINAAKSMLQKNVGMSSVIGSQVCLLSGQGACMMSEYGIHADSEELYRVSMVEHDCLVILWNIISCDDNTV